MKSTNDITTTDNADGSITVYLAGPTQTRIKRAAKKDGVAADQYLRGLIAADKPNRDAFLAAARKTAPAPAPVAIAAPAAQDDDLWPYILLVPRHYVTLMEEMGSLLASFEETSTMVFPARILKNRGNVADIVDQTMRDYWFDTPYEKGQAKRDMTEIVDRFLAANLEWCSKPGAGAWREKIEERN